MSSDSGDGLTDDELQSEIELVGDLVVAATSSAGRLPQDEIDRVLGVTPAQEDAEAGVDSDAATVEDSDTGSDTDDDAPA